MIKECIQDCKTTYKNSFDAYTDSQKRTNREEMLKCKFKEYDKAEFDKNFMYGLKPVENAYDYHNCRTTCEYARNVSGSAALIGTNHLNEYYEGCLR